METTQIEQVPMRNILMISNLNFSKLCPVNHTWLKVKVIIDCVIVKFLQLNSFFYRKQILVNPVHYIKESDTLVQQGHINDPDNNISRDYTLQLYDKLM